MDYAKFSLLRKHYIYDTDNDGFGCLWALQHNGLMPYMRTEARSRTVPPAIYQRADVVVIMDRSYPNEVLLELAQRYLVIVIDHHDHPGRFDGGTPVMTLDDIPNDATRGLFYRVNSERCAAWQTWEFFFGHYEVPELLRYVDDRDRYVNVLPSTHEVTMYLTNIPREQIVWDNFDLSTAIEIGRHMLEVKNRAIAMITQPGMYSIEKVGKGLQCAFCNSKLYYSDVANAILVKEPDVDIAAVWWQSRDAIHVELRSRKGSGIFVNDIAMFNHGGGHENASGYVHSGVEMGFRTIVATVCRGVTALRPIETQETK